MRLGDRERDELAGLLGRHYAEGRLDSGELDARLEQVYSAAGAGEAQAALADLPPLRDRVPARRRWSQRHGEAKAAAAGWLPTSERFVDPTTERVMRVWVDPRDRARHYVAEP